MLPGGRSAEIMALPPQVRCQIGTGCRKAWREKEKFLAIAALQCVVLQCGMDEDLVLLPFLGVSSLDFGAVPEVPSGLHRTAPFLAEMPFPSGIFPLVYVPIIIQRRRGRWKAGLQARRSGLRPVLSDRPARF